MKRIKKASLIVIVALLSINLILFLSAFIILEPNVKIFGFSSLDENKLYSLSPQMTFTDNYGEVISEEDMSHSLIPLALGEINETTINAFISVEDKRFFSHRGIDYLRIIGAALNNIKHRSYKEGGSTISQQLIKNTHLSSNKTIKRKIEEMRIAKKLERELTKMEILRLYLNSLYFGNGIVGVGTAANVYFGKNASNLSLTESATLAAIINSPAKYCPYQNPENCLKRRNLVLSRMLKNKKISKIEYLNGKSEPLKVLEYPNIYNHFFNNAINENSFSDDAVLPIGGRNGLKISTYFDRDLSEFIESIYSENYFNNKDEVDFSCIVIDNKDANVIAFLGSGKRNYLDFRRSPASTIKPIISYAPAFESHSVNVLSPILDEKTTFLDYEPSNYQDKYLGWTTVEDSLCFSSNIASVKLLDSIGLKYAKKIGANFGLSFGKNDNNLALALGGMENGLTIGELANAYRTLAAGGEFKECGYIKSIEDKNGRIVYRDNRKKSRAVSKETAFLLTKMLQKCAQSGTAKHLKELKHVAAKTGTNGTKDGNVDAYCISYSKFHTVAVWVGAKKGLMPNYISGGTIPARINKKIMAYLMKKAQIDNSDFEFEIPSGIIKLSIDVETLRSEHRVCIASDGTPKKEKIEAYFDKRNIPSETSIKYFNKFLLYKDKTAFE